MKTYLRIFIILFLFNSIVGGTNAQNTSFNESKYWVWRDRLINDFMVPGYCTGCGIVFKTRGMAFAHQFPPTTPPNQQWVMGGFDISDEGWHMGKYLIVLATEWRLLYNSGLPTDKTELEIYYELKTIERLDQDAEKYWTEYYSNANLPMTYLPNGSLDGFMIKDDVFENSLYPSSNIPPNLGFTSDSYNKYLYLNQNLDEAPTFYSGKYQQQNILFADHNISNPLVYPLTEMMYIRKYFNSTDCFFSAAISGVHASDHINSICPVLHPEHITGPTEYSKDNYIGLLQGLATVYKLLYSGVTVNGVNIVNYAAGIIDRIIHSIKENNSFPDQWMIDNPVTHLCVKGVEWHNFLHADCWDALCCEPGGAWAGVISGQLADIHNMYTPTSNINGSLLNGIWDDDMGCVMATLTGHFADHPNWSNDEVNEKITEWVDNNDDGTHVYSYLDLLFCILHEPFPNGDLTQRGFGYYENWLNSRSCCNVWSNCSPNDCSPPNLNTNDYGNFLTEMAVHNLLKLLKGETYTFGKMFDNNHYPGLFWMGQMISCHPITMQVEKEIQSMAILSSVTDNLTGSVCYANVTYLAGENIILKPGFKVEEGCTFLARIQPFDCKVRDGQYDIFNLPYNETDIGGSKSCLSQSHNDDPNVIGEDVNIPSFDLLGISNISDSISNENIDEIRIYPNPTMQFVSIEIPANYSVTLEITNIYSQLIMTRMLTNARTEINLSNNPKGTYLFKLYDQDNLVKFEKIILE